MVSWNSQCKYMYVKDKKKKKEEEKLSLLSRPQHRLAQHHAELQSHVTRCLTPNALFSKARC